ncbi:hypothetical protein FC699_28765 [Bacillus wiedmannii]|uniref:Uncharacterized protein n=1 Tax=Bacillus wiedmannii TaxID=1890302 RepID=A0A4U3AKP3_9BACI|nr:hypothetical protein FC694_17415 [Bacillus wiedmannii]TKI88041.1 hypothetical protein FC699_28765 [Bacillus wiedmannii]
MKNNQNSNDPCEKFQFPCFISISSCDQTNCCTPVFSHLLSNKNYRTCVFTPMVINILDFHK